MRFWCIGLLALCAQAQTLQLTSLVDDQVIQREQDNKAVLRLSGKAASLDGKPVQARVLARGKELKGFGWRDVGTVQNGTWSGAVEGVPMGGPYRVEVKAGGQTQAAQNVLVGDLWILAGQSNMEGVGNLENVQEPNELVHSFDMNDHWLQAREPLHSLPDAVDRVHWRRVANQEPVRFTGEAAGKYRLERKKGAGLGLPFAAAMVRFTGVPVGLVPCAHGGTSMDQWSPALKDQAGDSLYGSTLRRFQEVGGRVRGILWYQGESDASPKAMPEYASKMDRLIAAFREDLHQPELPFYYVQLGRFINTTNLLEWNAVQEAQRLLESRVSKTGMVAAVDTSLDDAIHVGTPDLKRLGTRLAMLACHDEGVAACQSFQRGPRPAGVTLPEPGRLRVKFDQVNGKLTSPGRLSGFSIHGTDNQPVATIYKARIAPDDPTSVELFYSGKLPEGASLRYGFGKDPYCNLHDEMDMAAPAFGPLPLPVPVP